MAALSIPLNAFYELDHCSRSIISLSPPCQRVPDELGFELLPIRGKALIEARCFQIPDGLWANRTLLPLSSSRTTALGYQPCP